MDILLIEDNPLKREKIHEFILSNYNCTLAEAASYNSGLNIALSQNFDLIVLDMSMPTFDRTGATHGGRFRAVAGKDIAMKLNREHRIVPFVILTGYKDFSVNSENLSIDQIDDLLSALGGHYKGCIVFDSAESHWKEKLSEVIESLQN